MDTTSKFETASADPAELAARMAGLGPRLVLALMQTAFRQSRVACGLDYSLIDTRGIAETAYRFGLEWWLEPQRVFAAQSEYWCHTIAFLEEHARGGTTRPSRAHRDKRFRDKAWSANPALRLISNLYLLNSEWLLAQVRSAQSLTLHDKRKLEFYTRQALSALSPSHCPTFNPAVLDRALETCGESLVAGLENLVHDLEQGSGMVPITQNDLHAFEVGRNLAMLPGKVVFRNALMELIQYAPRTPTVARHPLLVVPPWINKYYVLDLQSENSLLRWTVEQGHTVFVISWVNPTQAQSGTGFSDYMRDGPLAAIKVVQQITGEHDVNLCGFCIGGILTLCVLAYLAADNDVPVRSATLLATMVDFSDIGDTSIFIDDDQITNIERHTKGIGYLGGSHMKDMFSLLRENDLVWNYVVANYLLGRTPPAFDILHWNADPTRLPARMLIEFLRDLYKDNSLIKPERLRLAGRPINLNRITTPCYFLSTIDDHIAPWRASYPATRHLAGPVEFVLGGSGHIAGIVNPPARRKYGYWTSRHYPQNEADWLAQAEQHTGSWWPHWSAWLAAQSGGQVHARVVGSTLFPPLIDAPGTYVLRM
jgi:polyhydroxyalkanoate synthase subunit PhaC